MSILTRSSDFTDRDFEALRLRLRSLILSTFANWTDDQTTNFGNLLVELYAYVGDMLSFYQDNQAAESRITTATQRKNLLALAKLLNYTPAGASAATADVVFTLSTPVLGGRTVTFNVPITPTPTNPTTCKTLDASNPLEFQLTEAVVITAGNSTGSGVVENSQIQTPESFTSTGLANQQYRLSRSPYLDLSAAVEASDGVYTRVDTFLQSTGSDKHFVASIDDQDRVTVKFGNGTNGKVPSGTITVDYKTGGGVLGNVTAGTILALDPNSFVDSSGDPVTVTVTNAAAASGGADRESNERIRENAPASVRSPTRTVSRDDFETHALEIAGVDRALMQTRNEDTTIAENAGKLYVVPTGTGFPTTLLKNAVLNEVITTFPSTITFSPAVVDPVYLDIGMQVTLFKRAGYTDTAVKASIRQAVTDFFKTTATANLISILGLDINTGASNPLIDFGFNLKQANGEPAEEIALSDLFEVVAAVPGIRKIGDNVGDFQVSAYRVISTTTAYTGGGFPAVLVQALAHSDIPVNNTDFPRLKATVLGGAIVDIDLTIDGVHYSPGA